MRFSERRPGLQAQLDILEFMGRQEPEVPRGQLQTGVPRQCPQHRHRDRGQGLPQQRLMAWTAHPIEHHASDGQAWIVVPEAAHQGGQGPGLPACLHHQDDG